MKLPQKIEIYLKDFLIKGKFDHLKLGKTKEWVLNNFPDPDGFPNSIKDNIWQYGSFELYYTDNKLHQIYTDYIDDLNGGDSLKIDKWIFEKSDQLTLSYLISQFNQYHIDFQKTTNCQIVTLKLSSGVRLGFSLEEKTDESIQEYDERYLSTTQDNFKLMALYFKE